jgi:hypothetical protein
MANYISGSATSYPTVSGSTSYGFYDNESSFKNDAVRTAK